MSHQGTLSEEDFKVEGHCCAVTFPAIKTMENGIDFQADEAVKAYMAEHYKMTLTTSNTKKTDNEALTIIKDKENGHTLGALQSQLRLHDLAGNYSEAINLCHQILEVDGYFNGSFHFSHSVYLDRIATYYKLSGNELLANSYNKQAYEMRMACR